MGVWNVNYGTDLIASMSQLNFQTDSNNNSALTNAAEISSEYAKILSEKISEVEAAMDEARENAEQQQQNFSSSSNSAKSIETVKRFMPDGSIMITTYEDGEISSQIKKRPHLVPMPDYSAPPDASGNVSTKMVQQFSAADLLMMLM